MKSISRLFLRSLAIGTVALALLSCSDKAPEPVDAAALHAQIITVDTHADIPLNFATPDADPGKETQLQVDLPKMQAGNLNTVFFIVYVGQGPRTAEGYAKAVETAKTKFDAIHRMVTQYPDRIGFAETADDVRRLRGEGKLVAMIGVENGYAFGGDLSLVEDYYRHGMRYAGFAHMGHSDFADSSMPRADFGNPVEEFHGLSVLGRDLLAELNRLGVMADVSHASKAATLEIAKLSKAPVIASHSGVEGVYDHCRNLSDEELIAIRDTGGVAQIVAFDTYLKPLSPEKQAALNALRDKYGFHPAGCDHTTEVGYPDNPEDRQAYFKEYMALQEKMPPSSVADMVDHIDYAVKLIGIDHVGISSDFGGGGGVLGWRNASETENVTAELVQRGYSGADIRKLWGENLLRVMAEVQSRADTPKE